MKTYEQGYFDALRDGVVVIESPPAYRTRKGSTLKYEVINSDGRLLASSTDRHTAVIQSLSTYQKLLNQGNK